MDINEFTNPLGEFEEVLLQGEFFDSFKPSMLPIPFEMDVDLLSIYTSALTALQKLKELYFFKGTELPKLSLALTSRAILNAEVTSSQRIENNFVTLKDIYLRGLLDDSEFMGVITGKTTMDSVREAFDNIQASSFLLNVDLCKKSILDSHEILMCSSSKNVEKNPGKFRDHDVWIGKRGGQAKDARFIPVRFIHIDELMDNLLNYIVDDRTPMLIKIAISHYQFETIHPFGDGNGRIGRMIIQKLISQEFLGSKYQINLASYFEKNRQEYYDLLLHTSKTSELSPWIKFFLEGVSLQTNESMLLLFNLLELKLKWMNLLEQNDVKINNNYRDIINVILGLPFFSWKNLSEESKVSYQTTRIIVKKLLDLGIVSEIESIRNTKIFCCLDVIRLMESQ